MEKTSQKTIVTVRISLPQKNPVLEFDFKKANHY